MCSLLGGVDTRASLPLNISKQKLLVRFDLFRLGNDSNSKAYAHGDEISLHHHALEDEAISQRWYTHLDLDRVASPQRARLLGRGTDDGKAGL